MGDCTDWEKWLDDVKQQEVTVAVSDVQVQLHMRLANMTVFDLRVLKSVRPLFEKHVRTVAAEMWGMFIGIPKMNRIQESEKVGRKWRRMCAAHMLMVFEGAIDDSFIELCIKKAELFFKYKLKSSYQIAYFHHFAQCLADITFRELKNPEQSAAVIHAIGKFASLEQQVVMEEFQNRKVEDEKKKEKTMRYKAYHDALTGLPNRRMAAESVESAIRTSHRDRTAFSLFELNIDRFKVINEVFGRSCGNLFLQMAAKRFGHALRNDDATLFRINSDEFSVICRKPLSRQGIQWIAERLIGTSRQPYMICGKEIYGTFSIGIAEYPYNGESGAQLQESAEAALREAKSRGKNSFYFYNDEFHAQLMQKIRIENELQKAIANRQFVLFYQPQVRTCDRKMIGVEALIRWQHPSCGLLPPDGFISVAEETGLIREIGYWVLNEACRKMKAWQDEGGPKVPISVNLSFRQFHDFGLVANIQKVLDACGLEPQFLDLEITESMMAEDIDRSIKVLQKIRDLGVGVSLDDFGTGYSSLSYLKSLPINRIKIDRSFIADIADNRSDQAIVSAIVSMAGNLWIDVIAEGIETKAQLAALTACRCNAIQGYYFSKPLSENDFRQNHFF